MITLKIYVSGGMVQAITSSDPDFFTRNQVDILVHDKDDEADDPGENGYRPDNWGQPDVEEG